ncbi:MAG: single-stranded DNA-binding protein [Candidatus Hydrogenedens sp.]|nr:single-stranded DNA-binding protein [Candidatus Hydrogenedentota bacterium]NLF57620.1 single-stranded DNA-binding protein [Candidatus Hydrogenedens sp.]
MGDLRVPDLNNVLVAGRLTRDPELKYTSGGQAYCKIGVANSRYYKDKSGNRQEDTTFLDAVVWGPMAEFVGERLRKGRAVLLEGRLTTSEWEDRNTGQKRSKVEINARRVTPLEWDDDGSRSGSGPRPQQQAPAPPAPREIEEPIPEDDIPF